MTERAPLGLTEEALAAAAAEGDPESLAASVRLRDRFGPELAAAAVTQVVLRRRAAAKFGAAAGDLFFTRDGLEQATRPDVAGHHARRFLASGATRVADLGCGIGADAMAMLRAGLEVIAIERDPETADVARANLSAVPGGRFEVRVGAAEEVWATLAASSTAAFCDPARRTARGRSWRLEDLSPAWPFVVALLSGDRPAGVKLGPGLARRLIPDHVEAEWLSSHGDTVELGLWAGAGAVPGRRSAVLVESGDRLVVDPDASTPPVSDPLGHLYEPLGAVTRSGALPTLATELDAALIHPEIGYLTSDEPRLSPWASRFAVEAQFAYREKDLRDWVRKERIGILEIKTRGLGVDPAVLRRRLRLHGPHSATVVLTRARTGPTAMVVRRTQDCC